MDKSSITRSLTEHHSAFVSYINGLTTEEFVFSRDQKWTAGQQLQHIILCVKPLVKIFGMDKFSIEQTFGIAYKPSRTYEELRNDYHEKLKEGGKAPDRFVPEHASPGQQKTQGETLTSLVKSLCERIDGFTEQELDRMCIPHPLLGKLTMREMLYNAIDHVQHHHELTRKNLLLLGQT
jgi:hypothetical protein